MKIKLKDIFPNPYRDFTYVPIDQKKVNALIESIKQTGFWDNVVVRPHPEIQGKYQQAYGHNRLTAAGIVYGSDFEVDLPVRNLSDEIMLQMMANENMEYWAASPAVINETVRQAKKFLEDHPEVAEKYGQIQKHSSTELPFYGYTIIAKFLGWNESKVKFSLEQLDMIDAGEIEPEVIAMFDNQGASRTFVNTIKEKKKEGKPIPKEQHREIVQRYKDSKNSTQSLHDAVMNVIYDMPQKTKKQNEIESIKRIEDEVSNANIQVENLRDVLKRIRMIYDDLGGIPEQWDGINWHVYLIDNLKRITKEINDFTNYNNNKIKELTA